jgi:hypothetical protein
LGRELTAAPHSQAQADGAGWNKFPTSAPGPTSRVSPARS